MSWMPPPPQAPVYPGQRTWAPYGAPPPFGAGDPYAPIARPQEPPRNDYWATELRENPLGLENMHIRTDAERQASNNNNRSASSSTTRLASSSSYSRASDYANRNSYPPNANSKAALAPSISNPNTRVPSPSRTRHREREHERDHELVAPRARHAGYPETQMPGGTLNGNSSTSQVPSAYQRPSSRSYGGRTSVPVEAVNPYSTSSASAAAAAQMATRSKTMPGATYRQYTSTNVTGPGNPQAQGMQRSKTLPGEVQGATSRRERTTTAPAPRRLSDRYEYRHPQDDYEESEEEAQEAVLPRPRHMKVTEAVKEEEKERRSMERVRAWVDHAQYAGSSQQDLENENDREPGREARAKEKVRSKSYHHAPAVEDDYGGYNEQGYGLPGESAARYARERERERGRVARHATAPEPINGPISMASQNPNTSYTALGVSRVTEEPEEMHGYYAAQQPSRSQQQQQYTRPRRSSYNERDGEWREDRDPSGSSSGSASDDESEDDYGRTALARQQSTRERQRKVAGTPHPAPPRRLLERSDTLRVDDTMGMGGAAQIQGQAHLPSPRSMRQSSRTPSARPSYEQVRAERGLEQERVQSPNGHLTVGLSSASAAAAAGGQVYGTPPITPRRQDQLQRSDSTRVPYAPQPISSASAAAMASMAEPAPGFQTPARLAYLYRGGSASPSPTAHRSSSTQPQSQPEAYSQRHSHSQSQAHAGQYGSAAGYVPASEPKPKKRSPRASRSPSPLPPGQGVSSSSAYYASLGQGGAPARANSRSHGHSHSHAHAASQAIAHVSPAAHDGRRRSSSRAAVAGGGYSTASGAAAAAATPAAQAASNSQHVRAGFWNRRGDHLTDDGYIVYCPPGRCYPSDLAGYPDAAFRDHGGRVIKKTPDSCPELPESVPPCAGRAPERSYDSFITYVMVNRKS